VYARDVAAADGKTRALTFAVSGKLWQRSLVMIDSPTKSLWSHILGEAMQGQLKGTRLKVLPSLMTDWKTWRKLHPDTTVLSLSKTSKRFTTDFYDFLDRFLVGLTAGDVARAWRYDRLKKEPLVNDQFGGTPLLIFFEPDSATAYLYDRRVKKEPLTFVMRDGKLIDEQTKSVWQPHNGLATAGPHKGTYLKPLAGIVSYDKAWKEFHPESQYWNASEGDKR